MKVAYIAHPIGGDIQGNLDKIKAIGREINLHEPNIVPFAPYFFDCHCLDDNNPKERERGVRNDVALMKKGFIDHIRLYGDRISTGMQHEINLARMLEIKVIPMTDETKKALNDIRIQKAIY